MYNDFLTKDDDEVLEYYIYPIADDRVLESYLYDIDGGDNFADFCEEFFELLDEEEYWDDNMIF